MHTFFLSPIKAGVGGERWYVAGRFPIGNPATPLKVRLYGLSANGVRTIWQRDGLVRGELQINESGVTLNYFREYHSLEEVHETLHVTPNGLQ